MKILDQTFDDVKISGRHSVNNSVTILFHLMKYSRYQKYSDSDPRRIETRHAHQFRWTSHKFQETKRNDD